jgi:hypothetical protein
LDRVELVRWFPETARAVDAYPSLADTCNAFAAAGFHQEALESVRETYSTSLAEFLRQLDSFRDADTTMRTLTEDEFLRGKERVRRAVARAAAAADTETRSNWLDLLVLRRAAGGRSRRNRSTVAYARLQSEVSGEPLASKRAASSDTRVESRRTHADGFASSRSPAGQPRNAVMRIETSTPGTSTPSFAT